MPSFSTQVSHPHDQQTAVVKLKGLMDAMHAKYKDVASEVQGTWADNVLTFTDPDRDLVRTLGLGQLPALVHIRQNRQIEGTAEGWQPLEWRQLTTRVATERHWTHPVIPVGNDPLAFAGSPALG